MPGGNCNNECQLFGNLAIKPIHYSSEMKKLSMRWIDEVAIQEFGLL